MLTFDLKEFYKILQNLSVILGTNVTFFTENFENTPINPYQNVSVDSTADTMCCTVHKYAQDRCRASDLAVMKKMETNSSPSIYYVCPFGYVEIASRISFNDKPIGYVICGPFRASEKDRTARSRIKCFADKYKLNYDLLEKQYNEAPELSQKKYDSIIVILSSLIDYMQIKNYLVVNQDFFSVHIVSYIEKNLNEDLSVTHLCNKFGMSTTLLYKLFKTGTNTTPQKFIRDRRISCACKLLTSTDMPLSQICDSIGISDYNYFLKVFKSCTGLTPKIYRKKRR